MKRSGGSDDPQMSISMLVEDSQFFSMPALSVVMS
jgi:hypothetical protein